MEFVLTQSLLQDAFKKFKKYKYNLRLSAIVQNQFVFFKNSLSFRD